MSSEAVSLKDVNDVKSVNVDDVLMFFKKFFVFYKAPMQIELEEQNDINAPFTPLHLSYCCMFTVQ